MKPAVRILTLFLALILCVPAFVSCADQTNGGPEESETEETEQVYREESGYELPVNDYDGATCNICLATASMMTASEETGDNLNDAIYHRNMKVEDLYNVTISFPDLAVGMGYYDWVDFLTKTMMSGDDAYQIIGAFSHWMAADTLKKAFYQNLLELPYLDLTQPWWTGEFMEKANLGGALYVTVGSPDTTYYEHTFAMLFNKALAEDLQLGNLYELVGEGKWTFDKLKTYTAMGAMDVDGNGEMDPAVDRFGLVCQRNSPLDAFVFAFNVELTGYDADGLPYLYDLTDHYVEVQETLNEFIVKDKNTYYVYDEGTPEFLEGRSLFEGANLKRAVEYRAMENDFGILPYPMWNEEQGRYYTYSDIGNMISFSIPITTKGDMPANILEALAYFGYKNVMPVYYDKTLKGRTVRDEESQAMLDLMFANITYDFSQIYGHYFDTADPSLLLRTTLFDGKSLVTEWAKKKRIFTKKMEEMREKLS